jgi:uncharacterized protein YeaO (DUF488 family)
MAVNIKRIYEAPQKADGTRVLVDRLWPRGISKGRAALDAWLRQLAPSDELREWFHSTPNGWLQFRKKYLKELARPEAAGELKELYNFAGKRKRLTLLFASKNEDQNNATVLRDLLEGMKKPPTGTGPGAAKGARVAKVRAMPKR